VEENNSKTWDVEGEVKWFDPTKGFGFIRGDDNGADILLHANVLRNYGQSSVADGTRIKVSVQKTARGIQAVNVLNIEVDRSGPAPLADFEFVEDSVLKSMPIYPARVKWFDKVKGFGFANCFGTSDDVFLHLEVLRKSDLADLQAGEAICIKVIDGERGKLAAEVRSWESAISR
jgi:CspA family cold shock protein